MGEHIINPNAQFHKIPKPTLNIDGCENFICKDITHNRPGENGDVVGCDSDKFETMWVLKKVSGIFTKSGKEEIMPLEYFKCKECGTMTRILKR
ncbi:MAG: hypothetical protein GY853_13295 [PVC group bacterium]|nr:hypothetical protein [PVC group bacterium]